MKKSFFFILVLIFSELSAQTILNSPEEAKNAHDIDYRNIQWVSYQTPHYEVEGFNEEFLEGDIYTLDDFKEAGEVLMEKINIYRSIMGRNRLMLNDTGSYVAREYARALAKRGKLTHTLKGTTPTERVQRYYPYRIEASENLVHFGSTMRFESVDDLTDQFLSAWINSKGHNVNLLNEGKVAAIGIHTDINSKKNHQNTVAVFMILYRR